MGYDSLKDNPEAQQIRRDLKKIIKPGDEVYTILRHVSASGMSRRISVVVIYNGKPMSLDWYLEKLGVANRHKTERGLCVSGCGMDMGFGLVYNFARVMYPHGVNCAGKDKCCSNDHSNGDRDYNRRKKHADGGYAYRQRWL